MNLGLAYVALAVRAPERAARLLGEDLGLPRGEVSVGGERFPAFRAGAVALVAFPSGHGFLSGEVEAGLDHLGLTCVDPRAVAPEGPSGEGPDGVVQYRVPRQAAAGVGLRVSEPMALDLPAGGSGHIERIDHIGIASTDNSAAEGAFVGRLGLGLESRQTDVEVRTALESFTSDKYGVVYHQRPPEPVGGLRISFVTLGDCELEFLQDFDPAHEAVVERGAAGTTRQDKGAIARFVARQGPGLHHLALKTPDIDATLAHLAARGHRLIDRTGRPGSRRARIGFLHPETAGGVLIHFVERDDPDRG